MIKEKTFDTGEVPINYAEGPNNGPPLLLLHGGSWRWQSFTPILPWLTQRWHIYAPDTRGHGKSGRVPNRYKLRDLAGDTIAFVRNNIEEPCVVFGHSQGGWQALLLAGELKDRVRAVILGDTPIYPDELKSRYGRIADWMEQWDPFLETGMPVAEIAKRYMDGPVTASTRNRARWISQLSRGMVDDYIRQGRDGSYFFEWFEGYDPDSLLISLGVPVLLLQADPECGGMMTDRDVDKAMKFVRDISVARLRGVNHGLYFDKLEPVLLPLLDFLESLR